MRRDRAARLERKERTSNPQKPYPRLPLRAEEKSRSTQAAREHWSIENRYHHKRDASAWQEDRHRHRRPKAALNLALTRNALLAIIPFQQGEPLAHFFELYHRHPAQALNLILHARPVL